MKSTEKKYQALQSNSTRVLTIDSELNVTTIRNVQNIHDGNSQVLNAAGGDFYPVNNSNRMKPIYDKDITPISVLTPDIILEWVFAGGRGNTRMTQLGPVFTTTRSHAHPSKEDLLSDARQKRPHTSISLRKDTKRQENAKVSKVANLQAYKSLKRTKKDILSTFTSETLKDDLIEEKLQNALEVHKSNNSTVLNDRDNYTLRDDLDSQPTKHSSNAEKDIKASSPSPRPQSASLDFSAFTGRSEQHHSKLGKSGGRILHPRTGARLFLLINYSHHLARCNITGQLVMTSRTFRRIRKMTQHELVTMLQNEELEFIKDLYLDKNKLQISEKEELHLHIAANPLVKWALDFDREEIEHILSSALKGKLPVEKQLIPKYKKIQERGKVDSVTKETSRFHQANTVTWSDDSSSIVKKSQNGMHSPSLIFNATKSWRRSVNNFQRDHQNKKVAFYLQRVKDESLFSFFQRVIENERVRRMNIIHNGNVDVKDLRTPILFESRRAVYIPQNKIYDTDFLSNFQMLSRRLNHSFKITNVGDKAAIRGCTQNIKLIRDL